MKTVMPGRVGGSIEAPPSKSMMIRAVAASLLSQGTSVIVNPSFCADALTAMTIADKLGAKIEIGKDRVIVKSSGVLEKEPCEDNIIDCGESGLCIRMFPPVLALTGREFVVVASGSLRSRPVKMVEALNVLHGSCETTKGYAPIRIKNRIKGGEIEIDGSESSQFLTGLLMALPLCEGDSTVKVTNLKSKPYVEMTVEVVRMFGCSISHTDDFHEFRIKGNQRYEPCTCFVEGDWSGASFFLAAGAIAGSVKVKGLRIGSHQADKAIITALQKAGAIVTVEAEAVRVEKGALKAFEFDAGDSPDLIPPLVSLAAHCEGTSMIYGAERLKHKESDRAGALSSEFGKLGIQVRLFDKRMEVTGGPVSGHKVNPHNDHRIAMACAVAALAGEGAVTIEDAQCVSKSYPSFFEDLASIRTAL